MVFARLRQCACHLIHTSLGPTESTTQTASQSVQPYLHRSSRVSSGMPRHVLFPNNCPLALGDLDLHLIHGSLAHPSPHPNSTSIISAIFARPPNMDGSAVFARWRQCAPHITHGSSGSPKSSTETAPQSVQPFLHSSRQSVPIVYNGPLLSCSTLPLTMGSAPTSNTCFLESTRVHNPNGISVGSAVFAGLTSVTDRQTD